MATEQIIDLIDDRDAAYFSGPVGFYLLNLFVVIAIIAAVWLYSPWWLFMLLLIIPGLTRSKG